MILFLVRNTPKDLNYADDLRVLDRNMWQIKEFLGGFVFLYVNIIIFCINTFLESTDKKTKGLR